MPDQEGNLRNYEIYERQAKRDNARCAADRAAGGANVLSAIQAARPTTVADAMQAAYVALAELTSKHQAAVAAVNPDLAQDFAASYEQQQRSLGFQQQQQGYAIHLTRRPRGSR